jgi:hypothetical protein
MALTGVLLVVRGARLFARLALAYRKPAELVVSDDGGVRVHWRTELLDRTLGDRDVHVPRESLLRTTREVLYPRLATYAGLLALVTGTLVGVSTLVDGVRTSSPSLIVSGLAVVALGLGLDFAASVVAPGLQGRCRVIVVPRNGSPLCIGAVDVATADRLLTRLARKEKKTEESEGREGVT